MLTSGYINLNKLDKSKDVNDKGYVNITIALNEKVDQYGNNVSIWVNQTKEEREAEEPRNYLGNGKIVFINPSENLEVAPRMEREVTNSDFNADRNVAANAAPASTEDDTDGLPF